MLSAIYRFIWTPDNRGVGTGNLAFERFQTPPPNSYYGRGRMVKGSLSTTATPGYVMLNKKVVPVSILGQGEALTGQLIRQGLAKQEN